MIRFKELFRRSTIQSILSKIDGKVAIKTGLAGCLGWLASMGFNRLLERPESLVSGLWCTLTAIIVLQAHVGGTYQAAINRFIGVAVGSVMGGMCTVLLGSNPISLGISIAVTVVLCYLFNIKDSIRIASISVGVVMVLWGLHPSVSPWTFAFFRLIDSILGIGVAVAVAHLVWPYQAARHMRLNMAMILSSINHLYRQIIHADSFDKETETICNQYRLEIENDIQQVQDFLDEAKLELLTQPARLDNWTKLQIQIDSLFRLVMGLRRVYYSPRQIFDPSLTEQLHFLMDKVDQGMQRLSQQLAVRHSVGELTDLEESLMQLQEDLGRFRSTHVMRHYGLQEVESFFVFFYIMSGIVEKICQIAQKIDELYTTVE